MAHTLVIFGASGDLTSRKLIPALYRLWQRKRLLPQTRIVGVSRSEWKDDAWREQLKRSTEKYLSEEFNVQEWNAFEQNLFYQNADVLQATEMELLLQRLHTLEGSQPTDRTYYLSTMPQLYDPAVQMLGKLGMADDREAKRRIVIEKPFGTDLVSATSLNESIHRTFREDQVYRIDHYLGKETVQNILVLRFGNSIFEPLWNRNYVDHVQITAGEEVDVGSRAGYYDRAGVLRDMFQNHIFQLLMIIAMEAPVRFNASMVRDEKVKVLQSVRPWSEQDIGLGGVRGQYEGYLNEEGVTQNSQTETFAAMRIFIDNWRWKGVPFFLRSGKAMSCRSTQIVIQFRDPPHILFGEHESQTPQANRLVIQLQPAEGIQLHFQSKVPDAEMKMRLSELAFRFNPNGQELPDAYQRLLMDAMTGDASLFARSDEVEQSWSIIDPLMESWRGAKAPDLHRYQRGEWGPEASNAWIQQFGRNWFDVCPVF